MICKIAVLLAFCLPLHAESQRERDQAVQIVMQARQIAELRLQIITFQSELNTQRGAVAANIARATAERAAMMSELKKLRVQLGESSHTASITAYDNIADNHRIEHKVDEGISVASAYGELLKQFRLISDAKTEYLIHILYFLFGVTLVVLLLAMGVIFAIAVRFMRSPQDANLEL